MRWLLSLLLLPICFPAVAADRWAFTRAEAARCTTIRLPADRYPFEMTAPKTAYCRGVSVVVAEKPFLHIPLKVDGDIISGSKRAAIRQGKKILVDEPDLLVACSERPRSHFFYYRHQEGGSHCLISQYGMEFADCMFRVKCAKSLRLAKGKPKPFGQIGSAGVPAADYPNALRVWHDKTGKHRLAARLVAVEGVDVNLKQANDNVINVAITKLDHDEAIIIRDAEYYLSVQKQLAEFLAMTRPDATIDTTTREFNLALGEANRGLAGGQMQLRYRVIAVSGLLPPEERSMFGRYRLHLRPLFRFHVPRLEGKDQLTTKYRAEWYLNTWDFSPDQVVPGKTILELNGRAEFNPRQDGRVTRLDAVSHMTLSFPGADAPLVTFALDGGVARVYTPGQVPATGVLAMEFAQPTKLSGEAPPEELAVVEPRKVDSSRDRRREDRHDRREDRPGLRPPDGLPNPQSGFDFPKIEIPKLDVPKFDRPRIDRPRIDLSGLGRPAAERQTVNGNRKNETLQCEGEDVVVNGIQNEVDINGQCGKLTVNGIGNRVTVVEVAEIHVGGSGNVIQYEQGADGNPPRIDNRIRGNTVERVQVE